MEKEKRGGLKLVFVVGVVLIIFGAIAFFIFSNKKLTVEDILENPTKALESCKKLSETKQKDCFFLIAETLKFNNTQIAVQACLSLPDENDQKGCVEDIAKQQTDSEKAIEVCNSLNEDQRFVEYCYEIIASSKTLSIATQQSICNSKSGSDKDNCYEGLAQIYFRKNVTIAVNLCKQVSDAARKENCFNTLTNSPELVKANIELALYACEFYLSKSRCYTDVARIVSGVDPKVAVVICKQLTDEVQVMDCYRQVWFSSNSLVLDNYEFNIQLCSFLQTKKDDCLQEVVRVFIDADRDKAEDVCRLMSSSASSTCLQQVKR